MLNLYKKIKAGGTNSSIRNQLYLNSFMEKLNTYKYINRGKSRNWIQIGEALESGLSDVTKIRLKGGIIQLFFRGFLSHFSFHPSYLDVFLWRHTGHFPALHVLLTACVWTICSAVEDSENQLLSAK